MKKALRRISGIAVMIIMIMCMTLGVNASSKPLNFYYTGYSTGSHDYESFSLAPQTVYTFNETSHYGSFDYLLVYINNTYVGRFHSSSLIGGYPVGYDPSFGNPSFDVYMIHGSDSASFYGNITY
ncbi:MAG: hypothetical protein IKG30_08185 [Clostridiales bacterium]|nr:hypothetical protein [Clostridiales bacterium]